MNVIIKDIPQQEVHQTQSRKLQDHKKPMNPETGHVSPFLLPTHHLWFMNNSVPNPLGGMKEGEAVGSEAAAAAQHGV